MIFSALISIFTNKDMLNEEDDEVDYWYASDCISASYVKNVLS
jgi:hypothetical protein